MLVNHEKILGDLAKKFAKNRSKKEIMADKIHELKSLEKVVLLNYLGSYGSMKQTIEKTEELLNSEISKRRRKIEAKESQLSIIKGVSSDEI